LHNATAEEDLLMRALAFAITAFVLTNCTTTTSIENTWRVPNTGISQLTSVITMFPSRDGILSRTAEDKLAYRLGEHGMHAVPAYRVLMRDELQDRSWAAEKLRNAGFDGVIAMRVIDARQQLDYYPSFDTYWGRAWGSMIPETVVRMQVDAYALNGTQLVWSALSKSVDPDGVAELIDDVTRIASKELDQQRVIMTRR
jgi:hypothetical protein